MMIKGQSWRCLLCGSRPPIISGERLLAINIGARASVRHRTYRRSMADMTEKTKLVSLWAAKIKCKITYVTFLRFIP